MSETGNVLKESQPISGAGGASQAVRRHARNAAALTIAGAVSKVLVFGASVLIIRHLSLQQNGVFQLAGKFGFLYAILSELGIRGLMLRDLARARTEPETAREQFGNALNARVFLAVVVAPLMGAGLAAAGYDRQLIMYSLCYGLYALLDSIALFLKFTFRAYERMEWDAVASVSGRGLLLLGIAALVSTDRVTVTSILLVHIVSAFLECAALAAGLHRVAPLRLINPVNPARMRQIVVRSIPFAAVTVLGLLYLQTGAIVLSLMRGEEAVALLVTASKLPEAALFFPTAVINAVLPAMVRLHGEPANLRRYLVLLSRYLGFAGIVLGGIFVAEPRWLILTLFKPEYLPGAPVFQLLGLWVPLVFLQYVMVNLLVCLNEEKAVMRRYGAASVLNLLANLALIPLFGTYGAALALLASELIGLLVDLALLKRRQLTIPPAVLLQLGGLIALLAALSAATTALPGLLRITLLGVGSCAYVGLVVWRSDRLLLHQIRIRSAR